MSANEFAFRRLVGFTFIFFRKEFEQFSAHDIYLAAYVEYLKFTYESLNKEFS